MKKPPLAVARRYGRALLEVAESKNAAPEMAKELAETSALLLQNTELSQALLNPAIPVEKKKKLVAGVWSRQNPLLLRLLTLLLERGRMGLLPAVTKAYEDLWNEHRGIVAAEVVSAVPLAPAQREALSKAAQTLAGCEVALQASVDTSLRGGAILRMTGRTYDGSVRSQLLRLRAQLASGDPSLIGRSGPRT
jgi:F-type H+-transporting ATPase subunit delta